MGITGKAATTRFVNLLKIFEGDSWKDLTEGLDGIEMGSVLTSGGAGIVDTGGLGTDGLEVLLLLVVSL